jgi:hypothetical protein
MFDHVSTIAMPSSGHMDAMQMFLLMNLMNITSNTHIPLTNDVLTVGWSIISDGQSSS